LQSAPIRSFREDDRALRMRDVNKD
jgi:hypothetical protein